MLLKKQTWKEKESELLKRKKSKMKKIALFWMRLRQNLQKVREPEFSDPDEVVKVKQRNSHKIAEISLACVRTKVSSRKATLICNSYAKDIGWLTHENRLTCTLDRTKLERWRKRE